MKLSLNRRCLAWHGLSLDLLNRFVLVLFIPFGTENQSTQNESRNYNKNPIPT
jgi:hypothetical protein